jgi:glycosyltransferase involved in cell wall biosynthesis
MHPQLAPAGRLRVALDATPLLGARTGVGAFTAAVLDGLARRDDVAAQAFAVTWRGRDRLATALPGGVSTNRRPMAARPLRALWRRSSFPPIEWWTGPVDVVHGTNYVVPPARRAAEVVTVHDLSALHFPELCTPDTLQWPALVRRALARGAWVHTVSAFVADEVVERLGAGPDRVRVVPNGVDRGPTGDPAHGRRLAGADRYVLALATVEPRKGLPALVEAFDALAADVADVTLVLAGPEGWGTAELSATLRRARHGDRVRRLGWVGGADRAGLLAGAAAFAYPSRYEGFGLPPLEAMAAGVPVVATAAGAIPEVTGDAALLVAPGDTAGLRDALDEVLRDPSRADDLRARGTVRAAAFDWDRTVDGLVDLYRDAAAAL